MVLSGEEGFAVKHLSKDTSCAPDIHLNVVFLPCQHDFWGTVVSRGYVASHLGVLNSGETEVANLQIEVFVHEDVAWFQISVDHASRVNVFQSTLLSISVL